MYKNNNSQCLILWLNKYPVGHIIIILINNCVHDRTERQIIIDQYLIPNFSLHRVCTIYTIYTLFVYESKQTKQIKYM